MRISWTSCCCANPGRLDASQGQQLWDELAALSLSDQDLVTWAGRRRRRRRRGRLTLDAAGRPVRVRAAADRPAVEAALLAALRRGPPRATPFALAGTIDVDVGRHDLRRDRQRHRTRGVHGAVHRHARGPRRGCCSGGVRPPHTWTDATDFLETVDLSAGTSPPEWIVQGAAANDDVGAGTPVTTTASLEALTYGPVCARGTWPDLEFTPGEPFVVGGSSRPHEADSIQIPGSGSMGSPAHLGERGHGAMQVGIGFLIAARCVEQVGEVVLHRGLQVSVADPSAGRDRRVALGQRPIEIAGRAIAMARPVRAATSADGSGSSAAAARAISRSAMAAAGVATIERGETLHPVGGSGSDRVTGAGRLRQSRPGGERRRRADRRGGAG